MKTTMIRVVAVPGGWTLRADNGELPTEGRVVATQEQAYKELDAMYNNTTWCGRKVKGGYRIDI
jgi:hypothetical protein